MATTNKNIYIIGEFASRTLGLLGSTLFVDCSALIVKSVNYIETTIVLSKDSKDEFKTL